MQPRTMLFVDVLISTKDDFRSDPSGQECFNGQIQERLQVAPSSVQKPARSSGGSDRFRALNFKLVNSKLQIASKNPRKFFLA